MVNREILIIENRNLCEKQFRKNTIKRKYKKKIKTSLCLMVLKIVEWLVIK
jgi:hypothetical protein